MPVRILQRIGFAVLVLAGTGVVVSLALALAPEAGEAAFLDRAGVNLKTFFTFDYAGRRSENFPLLEVLLHRSLVSFTLIGGALGIALLLGVPTGVLSALRPQHRLVHAWAGFVHTLSSMPVLVCSILAMLAATRLFGIPPFYAALDAVGGARAALIYLLPMLTLALGDGLLSDLTRTLHHETTRILEQDYLRAVRARNVSVRRHLVRGLVPPTMTAVAGKVAYLIGGGVVVEYVFGWPGLAYQVLDILTTPGGVRDYPFILAATTLFVGLTLLFHLAGEVLTLAADPRLRAAPAPR